MPLDLTRIAEGYDATERKDMSRTQAHGSSTMQGKAAARICKLLAAQKTGSSRCSLPLFSVSVGEA